MKRGFGERQMTGLFALFAFIVSALANPAQGDCQVSGSESSMTSAYNAPASPLTPPGSPERDFILSEESKETGEDDDSDDRFFFADGSGHWVDFDQSVFLLETTRSLPVRRRFLEFCSLKLDC